MLMITNVDRKITQTHSILRMVQHTFYFRVCIEMCIKSLLCSFANVEGDMVWCSTTSCEYEQIKLKKWWRFLRGKEKNL